MRILTLQPGEILMTKAAFKEGNNMVTYNLVLTTAETLSENNEVRLILVGALTV